ncbi:transposase domain-containing protein [Streptomyces sp. NPDC051133]|uniref:transposase domain-containing protein n=1 Tax=Streptomyces sp. NPDC051133 TaxID=3155521 RepID=UPI00341A72C0
MFAPGHLGELTQIVPLQMVEAVLTECRAVQERVRGLPARSWIDECQYAAVRRNSRAPVLAVPG